MNQPIRTLSGDTMHELRELLARERQRSQFGGLGQPVESWTQEREIRWAKTTTNATLTTYPSAPANKFVVEFGDYSFDDTAVGNETATFTAYAPQESRVALSPIGFVPQNSIVRVTKSHGRWYIIPDHHLMRRKGVVTQSGGITVGGSGTVTIYLAGVSTSWTVTAHLNWMATEDISENKKVIVEYFPDEAKWVVTNAECE